MPRYAVQFIAHDEGEIEAIQEVLLNTFDIEKHIIHILELSDGADHRLAPGPTPFERRVVRLLETDELTTEETLDLARTIIEIVTSEVRGN